MILRDYQRSAVDAVYDYWTAGRGNHPLIVAPTGSGKTAIAAQIVKDVMEHPGSRVMIVTHVMELLRQGAQGLLKMYPEADFGFYSAGIGQKRLDKPITFAGIQSVWQRAFDMIPPPDVVIIDEAHMLPKKTATRYGKFIADLHQCNPDVKIVGLTATPYRLDSGMLHEGDGAIFDGIAYDIPIGMLIDQGYLSPVISKGGLNQIDLTNVKKRGGEFIEHDLAVAASDPELVESTVKEIAALGRNRKKWLIFSSGVAHAEMLADGIRRHGIAAEIVTGACAKGERARKISMFQAGKIRALVNCDVLTTGFDTPDIDLVAIVRATMSPGLYVQITGRGMRLADGKENCLVLDYGGNVQRHGFIDQIKPPVKSGSGDGESPVKQCPECLAYLHAAVRHCPDCNYEFPPPELNHAPNSYEGAMLSSQVEAEWLDVDDIVYSRHQKEGKPDSLKLTYKCGFTYISEWLCPDHGGFAEERYEHRRKALGSKAFSVDAALKQCDAWNVPSRIKVVPDGRFYKIIQLDYSPPKENPVMPPAQGCLADDWIPF